MGHVLGKFAPLYEGCGVKFSSEQEPKEVLVDVLNAVKLF